MHVKLTTSGGRRYVQLVESYRDEAGRVKKRTVATLGRAEQVDGSLDAVINGLLKITGREPMGAKPPAPTVSFESARALGDVWALTELWKSLGFSELRRVFGRTRHTTDVEALIRLMVLNRLCDPESKLPEFDSYARKSLFLLDRTFKNATTTASAAPAPPVFRFLRHEAPRSVPC